MLKDHSFKVWYHNIDNHNKRKLAKRPQQAAITKSTTKKNILFHLILFCSPNFGFEKHFCYKANFVPPPSQP